MRTITKVLDQPTAPRHRPVFTLWTRKWVRGGSGSAVVRWNQNWQQLSHCVCRGGNVMFFWQDDFASLSGPVDRPTHRNISDSFPRPGHWQLVMDEFPAWNWLVSCRKDQVKYLFPSLTCKFFYTFYVMCVFFWIFCLIKTYKFRDQIIVSPLHSWLMDISNCRC